MNFDPNMKFAESLKQVTKGLIRFPLDSYEASESFDALKTVAYYSMCVILRIIILITLPISAPIITALVQHYRRKQARKNLELAQHIRAEALDKIPEVNYGFNKNPWPKGPDSTL
jgi:hypothetical protein